MLGSALHLNYSKQIYHLNLTGGECHLLPAHPDLNEFVDYYWLLSITASRLELDVIPDTAVDLVLCPDIAEFAALYFPSTEKFSIPLQGPVHYAGVCFRAASAQKLLGSDLSYLRKLQAGTDTIECLGIAGLARDIHKQTDLAVLKEQFDLFWNSRLTSGYQLKGTTPAVSQTELIQVLQDSLGNDSIASVCRSLQISERQFRRLSNELFGLSPKKIQNVLRLQSVLGELFACEPQEIQDLYYDDSHRIRELKHLTGFTPQQIRRMAEKYNQV